MSDIRRGSDGETPERGADELARSDGENLSITIDLPEPVRVAPADEIAVSLDDEPVDPGDFAATTRSISLVPPKSAVHDAANTVADAPALPLPDHGFTRSERIRGGKGGPETAYMLTADRLVEKGRSRRPAPEGFWQQFVYAATFHGVNLGDARRVRERKSLEKRITKHLEGGTRFIPVLTRKGGVGKTTISTILGMALADVREDRTIAIDANPDRGTLAERIHAQSSTTVRDAINRAPRVRTFSDFDELVSRDATRLDILASDADPHLAEAFDEADYNVVADLAAKFYSLVITDCGTGIVHSVMRATLQRADVAVIVSGGSVDEARLASETLTWLESNGYQQLVQNAVVVINTATQGTNLVKLDEIEAHFRSRVREVISIPYDPHLAVGSVVDYQQLKPHTRDAARELAGLVVDGLPERRAL